MQEWREFYRLQPFGPWRDNYHAAIVAKILSDAYRDPKKPVSTTMADFFYLDAESAREKADKDMLGSLRTLKGQRKKRGGNR